MVVARVQDAKKKKVNSRVRLNGRLNVRVAIKKWMYNANQWSNCN